LYLAGEVNGPVSTEAKEGIDVIWNRNFGRRTIVNERVSGAIRGLGKYQIPLRFLGVVGV
jgi:hypothetical protein